MDIANHTSKMCWNCDGHVSVEAQFCPFCGSNLIEDLKSLDDGPASEKQLSNLYNPPYSPTRSSLGIPSYETQEESMYEEDVDDEMDRSYQFEDEESFERDVKSEPGVWPLLFLSLGMNLMTLGLLLFFFSDRGVLTLEWNSHFWFIYCILSTPLLAFGWKLLRGAKEFEEERD